MNTALAPETTAERYGINPKLLIDHEPPPLLDVGPPDRKALIEKAKGRVGYDAALATKAAGRALIRRATQ